MGRWSCCCTQADEANYNTTCPLAVHIFKTVLHSWTGHIKTLTAFWAFPWMEWLEKHKRGGGWKPCSKAARFSLQKMGEGWLDYIWKYFTIRKCLMPKRSLVYWKKAQRKPTVGRWRQIQQWQWLTTRAKQQEEIVVSLSLGIFKTQWGFLDDKL